MACFRDEREEKPGTLAAAEVLGTVLVPVGTWELMLEAKGLTKVGAVEGAENWNAAAFEDCGEKGWEDFSTDVKLNNGAGVSADAASGRV